MVEKEAKASFFIGKSCKSRSNALSPRTVYIKMLMLMGKFQALRIWRIMLILEKFKGKSNND